jgi:hypothetical protein
VKARREHRQKAKMSVRSPVRKWFFSFWPLLRVLYCRTARWTWVDRIFPFSFFISSILVSRSLGRGRMLGRGLKVPDLQVGELRGYRRSRCYPLCLYSLECPFSSYLISIVTELYDCTIRDKIIIYQQT